LYYYYLKSFKLNHYGIKCKVAATQEEGKKRRNFSPNCISRLYVSLSKEGTRTVELKQTVGTKTFYPSKTVTSNLKIIL
jgi:hypothetical protein